MAEKVERYSKDWANSQLRFSIAVLKGEFGDHWKHNLGLALVVRDRLAEQGFSWQARRVDNWIHRLQPRADSERAEEPHKESLLERMQREKREDFVRRHNLQPKDDSERAEEDPQP